MLFALVLDYVRKNKWTYLLVAVSLIVYDATLVIPTQVVKGHSPSMAGRLQTIRGNPWKP